MILVLKKQNELPHKKEQELKLKLLLKESQFNKQMKEEDQQLNFQQKMQEKKLNKEKLEFRHNQKLKEN